MECMQTYELLMKYMDGDISEDETKLMEEHFDVCQNCKEDFSMYSQVFTYFSQTKCDNMESNTPLNFSELVMDKIHQLPNDYKKERDYLDKFLCFVWGACSILCGFSIMFFMYSTEIIEFVKNSSINPSNSNEIIALFTPISNFSTQFFDTIHTFTNTLSEYFVALNPIIWVIFVVLVSIQLYVFVKENRVNGDKI